MKAQILILSLCLLGIFSYNPNKALEYADNFCDKRNPKYNDYSEYGYDSANFVSQCLIAGGEDLSECNTDDKGSIVTVADLEECLHKKNWEYIYSISAPEGFKAGGVIIINTGGHALFATSQLTFSSHTNDRCNVQYPGGIKTFYYYPEK